MIAFDGECELLENLAALIPESRIRQCTNTSRDADRIRAAGATAIQINTGSGCHLDAQMIATAIRKLSPPARSLIMIENVGNLVCPALFRTMTALESQGFRVLIHHQVPANDGGISFGQAVIAAARDSA